jgi:hypothetical protein
MGGSVFQDFDAPEPLARWLVEQTENSAPF